MKYFPRLLIPVLCLQSYAVATERILTQDGEIIKGKYLIVMKHDKPIGAQSMTQDQLDDIIKSDAFGIASAAEGTVDEVYTGVDMFAASLNDAAAVKVKNDPRVESIEPDMVVHINKATWGLDRIDDEDLPLDTTYAPTFGNGGRGVTAYIIDTGVRKSHNEFGGSNSRVTQHVNFAGDNKNYDCNGHGTHVAGTVGSKIYGVAPEVNLVGVKVLTCGGSGTYSGVIGGVDWVVQNAKQPAVANLSLGGGKSDTMNKAIKRLVDSGVTTVVAAGNSNADACRYSPAGEPSAITVGSTTNKDARSSFSNWGRCVDIFAPGSSITAPWKDNDNQLRTISGTSMASPHVCGAAALYLGHNPSLTPEDVENEMKADAIAGTITDVKSGSPNTFLYVGASKGPRGPTCERNNGKVLLEIMVEAGNKGDENEVFMKVKKGNAWRKRRALAVKGFENNKMTKITHCIREDRCYKIAVKDKGEDGMTDGDGSYTITVGGDAVANSDFPDGKKETVLIGCD